jgi:riboflavin kinase/FMN adenylyltransferase
MTAATMQMEQYQTLEKTSLHDAWVTIGSFDGVHRGHQEILLQLSRAAHASGSPAVMVTFFPHPSVVLRGASSPLYLTSPAEKARLAAEFGIDRVVSLEFTRELAGVSASDFIAKLQQTLDMRHLWVGFNFALGRNREGDIPTLTRIAETSGIEFKVFSPITLDGETISSSLVRASLVKGDVEQASRLLGRYYSISGKVVTGDGRGRQIGIPTANLDFWPEKVLPAYGIYAGWCMLGGQKRLAAANLGIRPTFESPDPSPRLEVYILDFDGDLYGQELSFHFLKRLRGEEKFATVDALVAQMQQDVADTRLLAAQPEAEDVSFSF